MPKAKSKSSAGDVLISWTTTQQQRIKVAISQVSAFISEARKLKSEIDKAVNGIGAGAEKMRSVITDGIERRERAGWERLVRENGESEAHRIVQRDADYTATPDQDERDEAIVSSLADVPGADADDAIAKVVNSLDDLRDQLKEIEDFLRYLV